MCCEYICVRPSFMIWVNRYDERSSPVAPPKQIQIHNVNYLIFFNLLQMSELHFWSLLILIICILGPSFKSTEDGMLELFVLLEPRTLPGYKLFKTRTKRKLHLIHLQTEKNTQKAIQLSLHC
ncbi:hypothetical protein LXL04_028000 [Taraxacum kok-saghyz]